MTYRNPAIQRAPDVALSILKPTRSLSCVFFQVVLLAVLVFCPVAGAGGGEDPADNTVTVVNEFYYPDSPGHAMNEVCVDIMRESIKEHAEDPTKSKINVLPWSGLEISGAVGRAPRLMALAGDIAADLLFTYWHETRTNIDEGYLMPLNEYIGEDEDGNGWIDDDEAIWPFWKHINPYSKRVATVDGKVYALPYPRTVYQCLIVRADLFQAAGLDPGKPPETWDEFFRMCQKLTYPGKKIPGAEFQRGQRALLLTKEGWQWIAWLWAAGGQTLSQYRTDLETGREYAFPELEIEFEVKDPETGRIIDLRNRESRWQATFASEAGIRACELFHKLMWQKWIRLTSGEPCNLTKEDVERGWINDPATGDRIEFDSTEVITGVARSSRHEAGDYLAMFRRGEIAMVQTSSHMLKRYGVPAENLSFIPIPGRTKDDPPRAMFFRHMLGLNHLLARPENKAKRDAAWRILSTYSGRTGRIASIRTDAEQGYARFMNPRELREAGLDAYVQQVPEHWRGLFPEVEKNARAEPFMGFWWPINDRLGGEVLDFILAEENFDYAGAVKALQTAANTGIMFERSEEELSKYRPVARILFGIGLAFLLFITYRMFMSFRETAEDRAARGTVRGVYHPALPWLMLAPAVLTVLLWQYYPLGHGSVMAFQDYHIVKDSPFVGLDTFINVFLDPEFWISLRQTIKYVAVSLGLTFIGPIILALLLNEVPRGKVFFRTLYFLPQVSSAIVIMLIWMLLYNPTEYGLLNQLIGHINGILQGIGIDVTLGKQDWLGDPTWAMIAVIIPSMWAQMGIASLIYLAALKSVDEDSYEAAEIDGAGIFAKIWHITIPFLKPLIIINFVAAFIGTFQNMGNILVMTGGGPAQETMVLSLRIWMEAYAYLRYSRAVAMAWILGILLIAFTLYQLRILKKVEFRRARES